MIGMNAATGQWCSGLAHIRQSLADILTTPMGSRVMRRDYGSNVPELIDQPLNGATELRIYAATAYAIQRWEPRMRLSSVRLRGATLILEGMTGQQPVALSVGINHNPREAGV